MAFIPIDAKADLQGQKKGKLTPAQHAQLNAWCLASKTGILECLEKCVANPENITAIQDKTTEITFRKGYLVICGRLVECEDNTKFTFRCPNTGTEQGKIIARFSLGASGNEEFKIMQKTGALIQNDLNENTVNGVYEFELYSYEATSTTVTLTRTQPYVPDIGGKLNQFITILTGTGLTNEGNPPLQGYDKSKGTIEERLTVLGFKEATISNVDSTYIKNIEAFTQGKVVAVNIEVTGNYLTTTMSNIGTEILVANLSGIDLSFIPDGGYQCCSVMFDVTVAQTNGINKYHIYKNGEIKMVTGYQQSSISSKKTGGILRLSGPYKTITAYI